LPSAPQPLAKWSILAIFGLPFGALGESALGIAPVENRVVEQAILNVIEPIFEREMAAHSYGFRAGRGAQDALRRVPQRLNTGSRMRANRLSGSEGGGSFNPLSLPLSRYGFGRGLDAGRVRKVGTLRRSVRSLPETDVSAKHPYQMRVRTRA
jgi:hypothetical protein